METYERMKRERERERLFQLHPTEKNEVYAKCLEV